MTINPRKVKGVSAAVSVAFFQSFESLLLPLFGLIFTIAMVQTPAFAGATMAVKEVFSLVLMLATSSPSLLKNILKKIRCKQGFYFIIAAAVGTTFGNISFIMAVTFAGSGYGVILTALYPIITITLINWIFKEKESAMVWGGVILTVISAALFVILPALVNGDSIGTKKIVGMVLGALAALFWSIEGVFINRGLRGPVKFTNKEVMGTRSFITALMSIVVILPLTSIPFPGNSGISYTHIADILGNWKAAILIFVIALNIFILRLTSIYAIRMVGPKITSVIDTFNFILPAILSEVLSFIPGEVGDMYADQHIIWWSFFLMIPIAIGVFIAVYFQKPSVEEKTSEHSEALEPK